MLDRVESAAPNKTIVLPDVEQPDGDPMGLACTQYNTDFWPTQASVKARFKELGYATPDDRDTMNDLGADATLGGGDDVRSQPARS